MYEEGDERTACGWGKTLDDAFEMLKEQTDDNVSLDNVSWYEATPISVSVKITKKLVLSKD
jgi:hypothetical protein